ncbi:hypothetical protein GA830_18055 (plasmid) [Mesorhizobium sp. NBSH29]|uniref:hypothetical protein n=1 Tax=Mesorhizobium sp. NBSH29 TaxID=2654249 RepID=UPI001896489D|nr:hypothetical protein [Mesorhizobium sp. NBSH29]QPC88801.1 hypothetical protein GA830_18055 [Mesorhizobium sp. NBSH29]
MTHPDSNPPDASLLRQRALSRWDNEGGAGPDGPQKAPASNDPAPVPNMGEAELVSLHIRVIALENLVIALLAGASDRQLELAREMAPYISPRPGFIPHPLTTRAADHMVDLVERASRFHSGEPS